MKINIEFVCCVYHKIDLNGNEKNIIDDIKNENLKVIDYIKQEYFSKNELKYPIEDFKQFYITNISTITINDKKYDAQKLIENNINDDTKRLFYSEYFGLVAVQNRFPIFGIEFDIFDNEFIIDKFTLKIDFNEIKIFYDSKLVYEFSEKYEDWSNIIDTSLIKYIVDLSHFEQYFEFIVHDKINNKYIVLDENSTKNDLQKYLS